MDHERVKDIILYLSLLFLVQLVLSLFILLITLPVGFVKGWSAYRKLFFHLLLLNLLFLVFGCIGNSIWMFTTYKKLYVSANTVVDYWFFYPFGEWILDRTFGSQKGKMLGNTSVLQLQLIWGAITVFVWASVFATYLASRRLFGAAQQVAGADNNRGSSGAPLANG